ncbi:MAG TPA: acyltransferase, partial [Acidimicrobiia bacterium]
MALTGVGPDTASVTVEPTVPARLGYMPGLDGVRGLFVIAVMVYHLDYPQGRSDIVLHGAFVGVDLFFVLSGYLITSLLLIARQRSGRVVSVDFWARRIRRLLPALIIFLFMIAAYAKFVAKPYELPTLRTSALSTLFYVQNYWQAFTTSHVVTPLGHTWSLSIEEQFYLLWPLFLAGLLRVAKSISVIAGTLVTLTFASAIIMWYEFEHHGVTHAYVTTEARAQSLIVGGLIGILTLGWRGPQRAWVRTAMNAAGAGALLLLVYMAFRIHLYASWMYKGGFLAVALISGSVIVAIAHGGT